MTAHAVDALWRLASSELDRAQAAQLEEHLLSCPECQQELDVIRANLLALKAASGARPRVDWNRVDESLGTAVARKVAAPKGRFLRLVPVAALAASVAVAIISVVGSLEAPVVPPQDSTVARASAPPSPGSGLGGQAEAVPPPSLPVLGSMVLAASGATMTAAGLERALLAGERLAPGDLLRTAPRGLAVIELPDESRLRLGASSELVMAKAGAKEIALKLDRGRLAVRAAHAPDRPFAVEVGDLAVRVVGTAFTVSSTPTEVEVSVGEGAVLVEPGLGRSVLLGAGRRVRFERAGWKSRQGVQTKAQREELAGLGVALPPVSPGGSSLPAPPAGAKPQPPATPAIPEPLAAAPQGQVPVSPSRYPAQDVLPRDVEGLFLRRAEEARVGGKCSRFQLGLGELVETSESSQAREKARIVRARCFDEMLRPAEAEREYLLYLETWPHGRFADEARRATSER